jgi:hypothetical protein
MTIATLLETPYRIQSEAMRVPNVPLGTSVWTTKIPNITLTSSEKSRIAELPARMKYLWDLTVFTFLSGDTYYSLMIYVSDGDWYSHESVLWGYGKTLEESVNDMKKSLKEAVIFDKS